MGNFYVNYTLRGVSQQSAAKAMAGRKGIVTPVANEAVVVFDAESDMQDQELIASLANGLSVKLRCAVLAILNHDDDILWYQLYTNGRLQDEYDSSPGYFDSDAEPRDPTGGDAAGLCASFGSSKVKEVEKILRTSAFDDNGYTFAVERHQALVEALGTSPYSIGTNYDGFDNDEWPDGLSEKDIIRTK